MSDYVSPATVLRRRLDSVLSDHVRPLLRAHGFAKSGRNFSRKRPPLYDLIGFQGSKWNGVTPHHTFFVNVAVGSTEIDDAVHSGPGYTLSRRWESLIPGVPGEVAFDEATDMDLFAQSLGEDLTRVLAVIDGFDTTQGLIRWAVTHNRLDGLERTCGYLAATGQTELLNEYVGAVRDRCGASPRWEVISRGLIEVTGPYAPSLIQRGLLDG